MVFAYNLCVVLLQGVDERVVIELFAEGAQEFTALVLDAGSGTETRPVTLLPTEVVVLLVLISFNSLQAYRCTHCYT